MVLCLKFHWKLLFFFVIDFSSFQISSWLSVTEIYWHFLILIKCRNTNTFFCLGLYEQLNGMNVNLEEIQKSLDMYLETKRQIFPRFYFLSNDDLLEILGQTRNPEAVQPHLKKCFDNIKSLRISKVII